MVAGPAPAIPTRARAGLQYFAGLDGVRAIAVLSVILYHGDVGFNPAVDWLPAGFFGVDMFFVLSGFLITSLLLAEWSNEQRVDFKRFYLRRARRLLPALFVMLLGVTILALLFARDAVPGLRRDIPGALLYVSNWWQLLYDQSYFELIGRPPLLQHLWSLAIEEQFYLLWPAVFAVGLRRWGPRDPRLAFTVLGGAVVSTLLMAIFADQNVNNNYDASGVYLASPTHMMGLLVGATVALVWRPWHLTRRTGPGAGIVLDVVGAVALAWTIWIMATTDVFDTWPYSRGGFLWFSVLVAVLIAAIVHPAAHLNAVLGAQPLRWIGERSYGIYLWHWPVMMITRQDLDVSWLHGWNLFAFQVTLTFLISHLSYEYVEMPIRRGGMRGLLAQVQGRVTDPALRRRRLTGIGAAAFVALVVASVGLLAVKGDDTVPGLEAAAASGEIKTTRPPEFTGTPATASSTSVAPGTDTVPSSTIPPPPPGVARVTAVGDSVMLGASNALIRVLGDVVIDAAESRQSQQVVDLLWAMKDAGQIGPVVVVHTGTNGVVTEEQLHELFRKLADVPRVVVVNDSVPRQWEQRNNDAINAVAPQHPNVRVANWNAEAGPHPEWFVSDGVHLTDAGQQAYADLINRVINGP